MTARPKSRSKPVWGTLFAALLMLQSSAMASPAFAAGDELWTSAQRVLLSTLHIAHLAPARPDPSNGVEQSAAAAALGKRLFFDPRLSANQKIACASCHVPERQFQDGRALAKGVGSGLRRTMPIANASGQPWFFWDGRKDSLWSQALGPLEDPNEHGGNRVAYAKLIRQHYGAEYGALFQGLPPMDAWPDNAAPNGTAAERSAWQAMSAAQQQEASRVFSNIGKAIAAYEVTLHHEASRFDHYVEAVLANRDSAVELMTASEKRGLRLFIGRANCISCHNGPLFTDRYFHNTGVAPLDPRRPATGRAAGLAEVVKDKFNCMGSFSDAAPGSCKELLFMSTDDEHMVGAFKTPGLRNVALRPPYMHAGQIASLNEVIAHYAEAPRSAIGKNERQQLALNERERADLVNFLGTLNSHIAERPSRDAP